METLFDMEPLEESGLKINEAQRRAITHGEGPLLVIAGAGTGKTRVITERIRHLLQSDDSLSGENILGLTFTKKAAGEMKGRVVKATGERGKAVTLATFHSFCETLLTEADPQRVMLDEFDHWILLRRNLRRLRLEKYRRLADPGQFLNDFVEFFSRCQDELVSGEDYQRYAAGLAARLEAERNSGRRHSRGTPGDSGVTAGAGTRVPRQRRTAARKETGLLWLADYRSGWPAGA